ncbi:MAG: hypothetical protein AAFR87_34785, partial [Bacteroidota bacterium]
TQEIKPEDLAIPLRISLKEPSFFMESRVLHKDTKNINFSTKNDGFIDINFSYIEPKEGFLIQVIHGSNDKKIASLEGTMYNKKKNKILEIDEDNLPRFFFFKRPKTFVIVLTSFFIFSFLISTIIVLQAVILIADFSLNILKPDLANTDVSLTIAMIAVVAWIFFFFRSVDSYFNKSFDYFLSIIKKTSEPPIIKILYDKDWSISEGELIH